MDINEFLTITRNPLKIFTKDDHPKDLSSIYELFDDISLHFAPAKNEKLELILIQTKEESQTRIVELLDKHYIVLEMQQVSMFSQLMEIFVFHEIDQKSQISLFHQLWIDAYKFVEFRAHDSTSIPAFMRVRVKEKLDDGLVYKFRQSPLTTNFVDKNGFSQHFEIIVAFILVHEISHYYAVEAKGNGKYEKTIKSIKSMPHSLTKSSYLNPWIATAPSDEFCKHQEEELFSDFIAIQGIWTLCVDDHLIDPALFGFAISLMYNCMYFFALQKGIYSSEFYQALKVRHATSLSHCLFLVEDEKHIDPNQYERFLVYIDIYAFNLILVFSKNSLELDVDKFNNAMNKILTVELDNDYIPVGSVKNLNKFLLTEIQRISEMMIAPNPLHNLNDIILRMLSDD